MAAGEPGQSAQLDSATRGLRQALLNAEDDAQRLLALDTIAKRMVVAATWPSSPDAVRTLTNSDGEHAMPLFSAVDTLHAAARRFGWAQPDGSLAFRELPAVEALRSAIEQGVHFVVLDIFAEHATEFSREEIAQVLQRRQAPAPRGKDSKPKLAAAAGEARAPAAPPRAPVEAKPKPARAAAMPKPGAAILGEIDMPFASRRNAAKPIASAVIEEIAAPSRRDAPARVDPRAEQAAPPARRIAVREEAVTTRDPRADVIDTSAKPVRANAAGPPSPNAAAARANTAATRVETAPVARPQVLRAPSTLKEQPAPRAAERARIATPAAFAPPLPDFSAAPPPLPPPPRIAPPPPASGAAMPPALEELPSFDAPAPAFTAADAEPALGFGFDAEPEPEANPAALQAAAMVAQAAKLSGDAETQKAAAEVAAMLTDMARKGVVEETKPSPVQSAAKMLAGMLAADAAVTDAKRNKRAESRQAMAAVEPPQEPTPAPEEPGLRPLDPPLSEALLDLISDALRKYPEVEWACEASDGSPVPVVGLRIDPAFQARAAEVRATVIAIAQKRKTELSVLLLHDPQLMKEARTNGSAFFPWRKRAAKR